LAIELIRENIENLIKKKKIHTPFLDRLSMAFHAVAKGSVHRLNRLLTGDWR
jgi:divalent metal cation (Fe/Co/Zn/Cd) transporter